MPFSAGYFGYQADSAKKGMKEQLEKNEEFLAKSVGKKFQGGIIFYSDSSRTHGLVAAYSDFDSTYNWKAAMKICEDYVFIEDGVEYRDWFLPSKDTLGMLRVFRDEVGGFSEAVYWSSSLDQFKNAFELNFEDGFPLRREDSVLRKVRAVHSF